MRPLRCSMRLGFQGISKWTRRWQWFCRSMPSEAASVASRMRTGLCSGLAWKAALIALALRRRPCRRTAVSRRSPPASPSAARSSCSHFWVARYSVKMITRSSDHLPSGLTMPSQPGDQGARPCCRAGAGAASAQAAIWSSSQRSRGVSVGEQPGWRPRPRRCVASSYSSSSAYSSSIWAICAAQDADGGS